MDLDEAQAFIRLSGGMILPPKGSKVVIYYNEYPLTEYIGNYTYILEFYEPRGSIAVLKAEGMLHKFYMGKDPFGRPNYTLMPVKLPNPCPPKEEWVSIQ